MIETFTDTELPAVRVLPDKPKGFDLWNRFFREKHGTPEGWKMVGMDSRIESAPDGFAKIEGGFRSYGKNGKEEWAGRDKTGDRSFFIRISELREYEAQAAIAAGACPACWGEGRIQTTMSVDPDGRRWRHCEKCGGDGLPKKDE